MISKVFLSKLTLALDQNIFGRADKKHHYIKELASYPRHSSLI